MTTRAGFVALIGEPNAGKSTLLNRMVGAKVSIVTHKVQTTRARIRGVAMAGDSQIVFVDTPGLFRPRRRLDRAMVAAAWGGAADADVIVLLIEAHRGKTDGVDAILTALAEKATGRRVVLAINKIDRVEAPVLLKLTEEMNEAFPFERTFMISAEKGHGVEDLRDWLAGHARKPVALPRGPDRRSADADDRRRNDAREADAAPARGIALPADGRDRTLGRTQGRLGPHRPGDLCARDGHKGIVLGKDGETIKAVGKAAREELEEFMGRRVHLFLQVKVRPNWLEEAERYSEMGLDFRDGN
jgi:GTPase